MSLGTVLERLVAAGDLVEPAQGRPVWHASGIDAVERTLAQFLPALLEQRIPCYLEGAFPISLDELGGGAWIETEGGQWVVPSELDPVAFMRSSLHGAGNYAIYQRASVLTNRLPGLPWWGPVWRGRGREDAASALIDGLKNCDVLAAVSVHPDATDLVIVRTAPTARRDNAVKRS